MTKRLFLFFFLLSILPGALLGCVGVKVSLETESKSTLKEYTLQGKEPGKLLIIPVEGIITDNPRKGLLHKRAGTIQDIVSKLKKAETDPEIKALLLEINSPGGTVTSSDILYHEIQAFKQRTDKKIISLFMDVAASGAYYLALPSDLIIAHPTTITGSVGVIFINPKISGTMEKLGMTMEVSKSGSEKDMGSPFRPSTPEERKMFQDLTDKLGKKFLSLVSLHRRMDQTALEAVASARIYLAEEAFPLKLIDRVGYLDDAIAEAKALAGLSAESKVVVYRRSEYPNDTPYNTAASLSAESGRSALEINLPEVIPDLTPGFYYLWMPGY
jgi:protease IV